MKIILSDKDISGYNWQQDVVVRRVSYKTLDEYATNADVIAIAGSRAMAIKAAEMDFPSLKLFQLTSAGFDGVPLNVYSEKGVLVANAGSVYSTPISETVVFGILLMAKRLRKNPNNRIFKITRGYREITELEGKSTLIMGAGNIGTAVAERLLGFGMTIDAYDPYCKDKPQYNRILRDKDDLIASLGEYDYIISTLPDNEETRGFIDKEIIARMKRTAVVVNVGRKAVFNNNDLYRALKRREIGGAVLDMFEKLPNPLTNKFRRLSNVIVLPGVSAISQEVNERLKKHMCDNISTLLCGNVPGNTINEVK